MIKVISQPVSGADIIVGTHIVFIWFFGAITCQYEDEHMTVPQIIESRGFICEIHYVTTADGYILQMHRIVNPNSKVDPKKRRPVLLQHGLLCSSAVFVINSPGLGTETSDTFFEGKKVSNTLAFALAMFDYDVWLANSRGNIYSINHTTFDTNGYQFWAFSFDEMIDYDLPASIQYILYLTGFDTLGYVGHSQGTATLFGLLASKPEYSKILKPAIALAPVAKVGNVKTPARYLANPLVINLFYLKGGSFLKEATEVVTTMSQMACKVYVVASVLCANAYFIFSGGFDSKEMDNNRVSAFVAHVPSPTSSWNMVHFAQMVNSNRFCKFDCGLIQNLQKYGALLPPDYNLKNIDSRSIALLASENDWLGDPIDTDFIRQELAGKLFMDYVIPDKLWNHIDFVFGRRTAKFVNVIVLDILKKFATQGSRSVDGQGKRHHQKDDDYDEDYYTDYYY